MVNDASLASYIWWSHGGSVFTISHPQLSLKRCFHIGSSTPTFSPLCDRSVFASLVYERQGRDRHSPPFVVSSTCTPSTNITRLLHLFVDPNSDTAAHLGSVFRPSDPSAASSSTSASLDTAAPSWDFHHLSFHRDHPELLCTILRKPAKGSDRGPAASRSAATAAPKSSDSRSPSSSRGSSVHSDDDTPNPAKLSPPAAGQGTPFFPSSASVVVLQTPVSTRATTASQAGSVDLASQVGNLTASVQTLSRALDRSREDSAEERRSAASVMRMLLDIVVSVDVNGGHRQESELVLPPVPAWRTHPLPASTVELARVALGRFDASPAPGALSQTYHFGTSNPSFNQPSAPQRRNSSPYECQPSSSSLARNTNTSEIYHSGAAWGPGEVPEYRARAASGPSTRDERLEVPQVPLRSWSAGESGGEAVPRLPSFASLLSSTRQAGSRGEPGDEGSGGHRF